MFELFARYFFFDEQEPRTAENHERQSIGSNLLDAELEEATRAVQLDLNHISQPGAEPTAETSTLRTWRPDSLDRPAFD
jgi:hypothetical protein